MPHAQPRIQVTPTERSHLLLTRLSQLTKTGKATIVRELLDEAAPVMESMLEAFEQLAKRPQEMEAVVYRMAAQAHQTISQVTLDLDTNRKPGPKPRGKKQGRGAANTG
jgi:hypothetical protein